MGIFQETIISKYRESNNKAIEKAYVLFQSYFHDQETQENIRTTKEEQFQGGFLDNLFVKILGYTLNPSPNYNLIREQKNVQDAKKADGAILVNNEVVGIIELKDLKTTDLKKIESQAFGYKNNHRKATYVITSNFEKLRFYINNTIDFVEFNLFTLTLDEFAQLWLCLAYENIKKDLPLQLKKESVSSEDQITNLLYKEYSEFKRVLFNDLVIQNPAIDKLTLFKKSQKLLDRFLFILFAEDSGLLPTNTIKGIAERWAKLKELDAYQPLYSGIKQYFEYINLGGRDDIYPYNGGLFLPDEILDTVQISDNILHQYLLLLSDYNFKSEVDVNILGRIFENSLTEIEEVTKAIEGNEDTTQASAQVSKRKKDGVFYTPRYITTYIVENTIGKLCTDKKAELEIHEEEYITDKKRHKATLQKLLDKLDVYREWLLSLTICDPACGSGAFLNAALDFLIAEHTLIDEMTAKVYKRSLVFADIENAILEKNLYGVDINEESVEIAKLSLWLRTAKKNRKLNTLSNNIKCGNSLISDPEVAGSKAFCWEKEFPHVFAKGGFDVVIGNPPYVDIKQLEEKDARFYFATYKTAENRINLYSLFIERGYEILRDGGYLSFINPNSMLMNSSYQKIRDLLVSDIIEIIKLPDHIFSDANVETIIFIANKNKNSRSINLLNYTKNERITAIDKGLSRMIDKSLWMSTGSPVFNIYISEKQLNLLNKLKNGGVYFEDVADFSLGITPYDKYRGHSPETIKNREYHSDIKLDETCKPLIAGENITRYHVSDEVKEYIKYGNWLGAPRAEKFFTSPRIIIRQIVSGVPPRIYAGYTDKPLYFTQIGFAVVPNLEFDAKYLLTLLNSKLINFYHTYSFLDLEKELFQKILIANTKQFPIPEISLSSQQIYVEKTNQMLTLNEDLQATRQRFQRRLTDNIEGVNINRRLEAFDELEFKQFLAELKKQKIELSLAKQDEWEEYFDSIKITCNELSKEIEATDKEIDQMVYKLYELTDEEIGIVENS